MGEKKKKERKGKKKWVEIKNRIESAQSDLLQTIKGAKAQSDCLKTSPRRARAETGGADR